MAADDPIRLTDAERRHQEVMRSVVEQVQDTPYVLKGGTALLLARDLPRHSTDLDFDSGRKLNIEKRIREGMEAAGVEVTSMNNSKDTDTVQRFKVHYRDPLVDPDEDMFLKIETSFRGAPDPASVEVANGIRTYKVDDIYAQKLEALGDRTKPRDLFDLAHLTQKYGDQISDVQLARAEASTADIENLVARYESAFERDDILSGLSTAEDTVLEFREAVEAQLSRRAPVLDVGQAAVRTNLSEPPLDKEAAYAWIKRSLGADRSLAERDAAAISLLAHSPEWRVDSALQKMLPNLENPRDHREVIAKLVQDPQTAEYLKDSIGRQPGLNQRLDDIRGITQVIRDDTAPWMNAEGDLKLISQPVGETINRAVTSLAETMQVEARQEQRAEPPAPSLGEAPKAPKPGAGGGMSP